MLIKMEREFMYKKKKNIGKRFVIYMLFLDLNSLKDYEKLNSVNSLNSTLTSIRIGLLSRNLFLNFHAIYRNLIL